MTQRTLLHPSPADWLMFSRTYDAQRFSPLRQINRGNVRHLKQAWSVKLPRGVTETVPLAYRGVVYVIVPGGGVQAMDGQSGKLIWRYTRTYRDPSVAAQERTKALAIYKDLIYFTAPDGYIVALDARTGKVRWETYKPGTNNTSGAIVVDGKVISGGNCVLGRENCFIEADDADSGKRLWRFHTIPAPGEPGYASWNGTDVRHVIASTWGQPGSFDPVRDMIYWGTGDPNPNERLARHGGNPDGTSRSSPADLFSNCTLALNPVNGKLEWYYQDLPGNDWDMDDTRERVLARVRFDPDPKSVKWINSGVRRGSLHDVVASIADNDILYVLDRDDGRFLWAKPIPVDPPNLPISGIDGKSGKVTINWPLVSKRAGEKHQVCYFKANGYWPASFDPQNHSLYATYFESCDDVASDSSSGTQWATPLAGTRAIAGIAKIDLSNGRIFKFDESSVPAIGAVLTTAGGLVFNGKINGEFDAFDVSNGVKLWGAQLPGPVSVSTITYRAGGKQFVLVMTGDSALYTQSLSMTSHTPYTKGGNAIYAFELPTFK